MNKNTLLEDLKGLVVQAGELARRLADDFTLETKSDDSFVTSADRAVESYPVSYTHLTLPTTPYV